MGESSDKAVVLPGSDPEKQSPQERRRALRYPCAAAAEVYDLQSQTRLTGRCSDVSLGGCYVDTLAPLAVGSQVRVRIQRDLVEFEAEAVVSYAHVSMGMGLAFSKMKPEHQAVLRSWIAELSGGQVTGEATPPAGPAGDAQAEIDHLRQVLTDVIQLMIRKKILAADEAARILGQLSR
jgi:hypothetical protein